MKYSTLFALIVSIFFCDKIVEAQEVYFSSAIGDSESTMLLEYNLGIQENVGESQFDKSRQFHFGLGREVYKQWFVQLNYNQTTTRYNLKLLELQPEDEFYQLSGVFTFKARQMDLGVRKYFFRDNNIFVGTALGLHANYDSDNPGENSYYVVDGNATFYETKFLGNNTYWLGEAGAQMMYRGVGCYMSGYFIQTKRGSSYLTQAPLFGFREIGVKIGAVMRISGGEKMTVLE